MALVSSASQDAIAAPEQALSHANMRQPHDASYFAASPSSTSHRRPASPFAFVHSSTQYAATGPRSDGDSSENPAACSSSSIVKHGRPQLAMPGTWQSEEGALDSVTLASDGLATSPSTGSTKTLPSPITPNDRNSARKPFIANFTSRLRTGLAAGPAEYSPSIYSPTESEVAGPSPSGIETAMTTSSTMSPMAREQAAKMSEPTGHLDSRKQDDEDDEGHEDGFSQATLSLRAEEILANAKKRLTAMEGNLSRARAVSASRPSSSASSFETGLNASPRSPARGSGNSWAISAAKLRQSNGLINGSPGGHARVVSDPSYASQSPVRGSPGRDQLRIASAMGATAVTGTRRNSSNSPPGEGLLRRHRMPLEPLQEDDLMSSLEDDDDDSSRSASPVPQHPHSLPPPSGVDRSANRQSSMQLNALREQMQDLKSKISSLTLRTQEDPLQRRSLQSSDSHNSSNTGNSWSPNARGKSVSSPASSEARKQSSTSQASGSASPDIGGAVQPLEHGSARSSNHSSLQSFPGAHEDRPDALDYSTYIVNSTMGSFSRQGHHRSSRSSSLSSGAASASTERPALASGPPSPDYSDEEPTTAKRVQPPSEAEWRSQQHRHLFRGRQPSTDSISTVATYATATSTTDLLRSRSALSSSPPLAASNGHGNVSPTNTRTPANHTARSVALAPRGGSRSLGVRRPLSPGEPQGDAPSRDIFHGKLNGEAHGTLANADADSSPKKRPAPVQMTSFLQGEVGTLAPHDLALVQGVLDGLQGACRILAHGASSFSLQADLNGSPPIPFDSLLHTRQMLESMRKSLEGLDKDAYNTTIQN